MMNHNLDYCMV